MIFKEGIQSFYKGFIPSLLMSSYGILSMYIYENLKLVFYRTEAQKTSIWRTFLIGSLSRGISSSLLYPLSLLRTRIQKEQIEKIIMEDGSNKIILYKGFINSTLNVFQNEGMSGFYKGYLINLVRIIPANGVFFFVYEYFLKHL